MAVVFAGEETAQIISQESDISPEGLYQYAYETDNGIVVKEQGAQKDLGEEKSSVSICTTFCWSIANSTLIT